MSEFIQPSEAIIHQQDPWRLFRIISEFVQAFDTFHAVGPFISVFGSSRLKPSNPYYEMSYDVATKIAQRGFSIITGAGPGLMESANKAAQEANQGSAGLIPDVPFEPEPNGFLDPKLCVRFRYFFVRKVTFVRYSQGFVFLPGGYGTLDELFEILTLIQTKKIQPVPIYLMGSSYWKGLIQWMKDFMVREGCLDKEEMNLFTISDDPEYVADGLLESYQAHLKIHDFLETI
jgi:uncharacterized protein (TIGR00730 family)